MAKQDKNTIKNFAVGAALAAAAGYVAGILTAPKSGKQTRAHIQHKAVVGKVEAEKQLKKLHTQLGKALTEAKTQAAELKGRAKTEMTAAAEKAGLAKEKARDLLSA